MLRVDVTLGYTDREMQMSEQRFIDIETKLAHQDHALIELNAAVTKQQEIIMKLEQLCASMSQRIASLNESDSTGHSVDERPPHY